MNARAGGIYAKALYAIAVTAIGQSGVGDARGMKYRLANSNEVAWSEME